MPLNNVEWLLYSLVNISNRLDDATRSVRVALYFLSPRDPAQYQDRLHPALITADNVCVHPVADHNRIL